MLKHTTLIKFFPALEGTEAAYRLAKTLSEQLPQLNDGTKFVLIDDSLDFVQERNFGYPSLDKPVPVRKVTKVEKLLVWIKLIEPIPQDNSTSSHLFVENQLLVRQIGCQELTDTGFKKTYLLRFAYSPGDDTFYHKQLKVSKVDARFQDSL